MTSEADISRTIAAIMAREGGFVNDPVDPGGATNYGITQATADDYHAGNVRDLTLSQAMLIYRNLFRDDKIDQIPDPATFDLVADCVVNHGQVGVKWLQSALGAMTGAPIVADGAIGSLTLAAMGKVTAWARIRASILGQRIRFYGRICVSDPTQLKFLNGWLSRATGFLA